MNSWLVPDGKEPWLDWQKTAGEQKLSVLYGLDQLDLCGIMGIEAQCIQGKHDGILPGTSRLFCVNAVQFSGVDEVQRLGMDEKLFHINLQSEFSAEEIQYLYLIVPVMLDESSFSDGTGLIDGTGK